MCRILVTLSLLLLLSAVASGAPCAGRLFYQTQDSKKISWVAVSSTGSNLTSDSASTLASSASCTGGMGSYASVVCCPTNADIRCWDTSLATPTHYDLGVGLPSSITPPYDLRLNTDVNRLLLGSRYIVSYLQFSNSWNNGTGTWDTLQSTSGPSWNILNLNNSPFYHVLFQQESKIVRINGQQTMLGNSLVTATSVQSVTSIGTESFAVLTTGALLRWIEDGSATAVPAPTTPSTTLYAGYNLTGAYSVDSCPYYILYSSSGDVVFGSSGATSTMTSIGTLASSVTYLVFGASGIPATPTAPVAPAPVPVIVPEAGPVAAPMEAPVAEMPVAAFVPTPPPSNCRTPPPQPAESFNCINGTWTSNSSVTAPQVIVTGYTVFSSNLTVTNLTILGLQSSVVVYGCAAINGTLSLNLTEADLQTLSKISINLLSVYGCTSSANLSTIPIAVNAPTKGCDKLTYTLGTDDSHTATTLTMIVSLQTDPCKNPRSKAVIIGSSVAAGAVVLGAAGLALAVSCSTRVRSVFRPFAKGRPY